MATETTTIRVPRETRDLLAKQAKERGVSVSSMLTNLARRETREAIFRAERQASTAESEDPGAVAEAEDWEEANADGID